MHPPLTVYVVSAPSGTGKTTLNRRLVHEHPNIQVAVSYTTRPRRQGEREGVDYHFVSGERFRELIDHGEMLEYAEVFGTLYGTSRLEVQRLLGQGQTVILEIDVQGWRQARLKLAQAKSVFILPPSIEALWKRLEGRGTETLEVRWRRLMAARHEISCGGLYDYFIMNNDLEEAYRELELIIFSNAPGRIGKVEGTAFCQKLLAEFDESPWLQRLARDLTKPTGSSSSA